ncbi:hypothetical protein P9X10_01500 [Bacillus cereus]|nr:hypothetical protein [Bacillus cereus]
MATQQTQQQVPFRQGVVFSTVKEFKKEWDAMRLDIFQRHNIIDPKKARLGKAIKLYQMFNGNWYPITTVKGEMQNRIKMYEGIPNRQEKFILVALL